jgi:hypothetical protein
MMQSRDQLNDPKIVDYPSYGLNSLVVYGRGGTLADVDRQMPTRPLDTIIVADLGPDNAVSLPVAGARPSAPVPAKSSNGAKTMSAASSSGSSGKVGPARNKGMLKWDDGYDPLAFDSTPSWLTARHGGGINVLTLAGGVRAARTAELMRRPVRRYYPECAAGGCSLCTARQMNQVPHYSFAQDRLYWWTGPVRAE